MYKMILRNIGKFLLLRGMELIFNFLDKDKNGEISKEELKIFNDLIKNKIKSYKK
jgi:Ca2+-binding EF-hand superfamily protein